MAESDRPKDTAAQENLLSALDSIKRLLDESERKNPLLEKVVAQVEEAQIPVLNDVVIPEPEIPAEDAESAADEFVFEAPEPTIAESTYDEGPDIAPEVGEEIVLHADEPGVSAESAYDESLDIAPEIGEEIEIHADEPGASAESAYDESLAIAPEIGEEIELYADEPGASAESAYDESLDGAPPLSAESDSQAYESGISVDALRAAVEVLRSELERRIDEHIEEALAEARGQLKTELSTSLDALVEELVSSQYPDD